jgi:YgiT-type zinc finger domain-containing protein
MLPQVCPICDETGLVERRGEYRMDLSPNIAGDAVVVTDADWLHCDECGEDILSKEFEEAINQHCRAGKNSRGA